MENNTNHGLQQLLKKSHLSYSPNHYDGFYTNKPVNCIYCNKPIGNLAELQFDKYDIIISNKKSSFHFYIHNNCLQQFLKRKFYG